MKERKESLLRKMPTFLYFEECFETDGKTIMGEDANLPEFAKFLNCPMILSCPTILSELPTR